MHILDNPETYQRLDPSNMLEHLHRLPGQCEAVWQQAQQFGLPSGYSNINKVVILGMGGSAIGGELAQGLVAGKALVVVQRDYSLPFPPDEKTLIIASSYSGETEETLSAFTAALAYPAKCLAITTGGKLKAMAEKHGKPVFTIDYQSPPRAALAYSLIPILAVLHQAGLLPAMTGVVNETIDTSASFVRRIMEQTPLSQNPAKELATRLHGRIAVIYGAEFLSGVARRWKTQINENSKSWAFFEILPELDHNAVVGYPYPKELRRHLAVVILHSELMSPRIRKRVEVTSDILKQLAIPHVLVNAEGKSQFGHMMSLVFLGDYASYYLALLNECDPTPVEVIDFLKKSLG